MCNFLNCSLEMSCRSWCFFKPLDNDPFGYFAHGKGWLTFSSGGMLYLFLSMMASLTLICVTLLACLLQSVGDVLEVKFSRMWSIAITNWSNLLTSLQDCLSAMVWRSCLKAACIFYLNWSLANYCSEYSRKTIFFGNCGMP